MKYFIFITDKFPEEFVDDESSILLETGFKSKSDDDEIPLVELRFMTTVVVKSSKPEKVIEEFRRWWPENSDGEMILDLIATKITQLESGRVEVFQNMDDDSWSMKSGVVVYKASSQEAEDEARGFIKEYSRN